MAIKKTEFCCLVVYRGGIYLRIHVNTRNKMAIKHTKQFRLPQQLLIALHEDNISAIKLTKNENAPARTKHIQREIL